MARVLPDGYDILVWYLNETSGAYRNTGTFQPNSSTTDLTVQNTVDRLGNGLFGDNCLNFPGTSNFPSGSSSTRNAVIGANTVNPAFPITISCWINIRNYPASNNFAPISKQFRDTNITNVWSAPFYALDINILAGGNSWTVALATAGNVRNTFQIDDFPIPLQQWSHIGLTYDGYILKAFLNGCHCINFSSGSVLPGLVIAGNGTPISYTDGSNGFGPWKLGSITATGASNKEEGNYQIQDFRVANIARPLSYFQRIYKFGVLPINLVNAVQYYKLRAYDMSCTPNPQAVVWVDTEVSLANAPSAPCSGPLTDPEVLEVWWA